MILKHLGHTPTMAREPCGHRWGKRRIARRGGGTQEAGVIGAKVIYRPYQIHPDV